MAIRFLIDENLLGRLSRAVARHNARGVNLIDAVQVGDIPTSAVKRGSGNTSLG